jgi:hypothetical protein
MLGRQVRSVGIAVTVTAVAVQTLAYVANEVLFGGRFEQLRLGTLPDGTESPYFTWMSTSATFAAAFTSLLLALAFAEHRSTYGLLAAALAYYSLDDLAQIHERVPGLFADLGLPRTLVDASDFLLFAPVALLVLVLLGSVARQATAHARVALNAGLLLLVVSVLLDEGVRPLTQRLEWRGVAAPEAGRIAVEEGLELAGMMLVATALATILCVRLGGSAAHDARDDGKRAPYSAAAGG